MDPVETEPEAPAEESPQDLLEGEWEETKEWEERARYLVEKLESGTTWDSLARSVIDFQDSQNRPTPTFLHFLSEGKKGTEEFYKLPEPTYRGIIASLLEDHLPSAAGSRETDTTDDNNNNNNNSNNGAAYPEDAHPYERPRPILTVALSQANFKFLTIIATHFREHLPCLLQVQWVHDGQNALHTAFDTLAKRLKVIHNNRRLRLTRQRTMEEELKEMTKIVREWVEVAPAEAIAKDDKFHKTPLHHAMNYELCHYLDAEVYRSIVITLIDRGKPCQPQPQSLLKDDHPSPYRIYVDSQAKFDAEQQKEEQQQQKGAASSRSGPPSGSAADKRTAGVGSNQAKHKLDGKIEEGKEKANASDEGTRQAIPQRQEQPFKQPPMHSALDQRAAKKPASQQFPTPAGLIRQNSLRPDQDLGLPVAAAASFITAPRSPMVEPRSTTAAKKPGMKAPATRQGEIETRRKQAADTIRQYLRLHYIRTMSDMDAKNLLYGNIASDKNLYFDAKHLRGREPSQVVELIRRLYAAGGFEDTLSYVKIPQLSEPYWLPATSESGAKANNTANQKRPRKNAPRGLDTTLLGRNALVSVFDELVKAKVTRILRLEVEDNGDDLAHSDTAIERAIKGRNFHDEAVTPESRDAALEIETWDWKKPDISLELIYNAAPRIKHLHLHWSGAQVVLRGWEIGIAELYKQYKELRSVHLHAYQGFESEKQTERMMDDFKNGVTKLTEGRVQVRRDFHKGRRVIHTRADDEFHHSSTTSDASNEEQYQWLTRVEEFRDAMLEMQAGLVRDVKPLPQVKVALIDDGLDYGDIDVYPHTTVRGISCYPPSGPSGQTEHPWHQSTHGHGTAMANMILRINPWIHLLVIRIEDGVSYAKPNVPSRTINPNSVAHAIETAIIHKVDIISMSWTVRQGVAELRSPGSGRGMLDPAPKKAIAEPGMTRLENAIARAAGPEGILMVCSAADDLELLGKDTLPYSAAKDQVFRIGACNSGLQRDVKSEDKQTISYFLPGIQVPEARRPHSARPPVYHDGSSVATALAAGLMSMILHCARYMAQCEAARLPTLPEGGLDHSRPYEKWSKQLCGHANMRVALNNIVRSQGQGDPEDLKQFPPRFFKDRAEKLKNANGSRQIDVLAELVTFLCHGIST